MAETDLRDALALERTHLANERTFLAYIRTALALLAGGAMALKFLERDPLLIGFAWLAVILGTLVLVIGSYRFVHVRRRISKS